LQWNSVLSLLGRLAIFLVAAIVAGLLLVPRLLRFVAGFRRDETLLVAVLGLCFGFALLAAELNFSVGLGAFIIGAVIAESDAIRKIERLAAPLRDMFSAVFFVAIGLLIEPALVRDYAVPIAIITVVIVVGKILACSFGCVVAGFERGVALRAGLGLAQIGEFSFIIAALGVSVGATSKFLYPIAVTVSALTTVLTPYLIRHADRVVWLHDRFAPRSLLDYLDDYAAWARTFWQGRRVSMPRKLLGKVLAQLAVNFALIAACFLAAVFVHGRGWVALERWPSWLGSAKTALWLGALVLSLPVVIATLRKLQAFGMMIGELTVSHPSEKQRVVLRALVANTVLFTGCVMLALMVLLLSSVLLPPGEVLILLTGIAILLAVVLRTSFVRIYARAQGVIREILSREESAHVVEHRDELPSLLEEAQLMTLRVNDGMPAAGRTIGDLQLRTRSGASVVVVKRGVETITNPDPDVDIRAGDEVLLLGTPPQLREARKALESGGE
jgi:CPA2 family monovalent cation:H+ antiporter-2